MKTICLFNGDMSRGGGTERITQLLANGLNKTGKYRVIVLNLKNESGHSFFKLDDNVVMLVLKNASMLKKIIEIRQLLVSLKINIIINVDVMLAFYSMPAIMTYSKTKMISWETFTVYNDIGSRNTTLIRSICLRRSAYYINQTKGDMNAFKQKFKIKCPITYIYNPCDVKKTNNEYNASSQTIITAGNFFYTKGYDLAIEVAKIVFSRYPQWCWKFYGDGILLNECKTLVESYNLNCNVHFCGRVTDMEEVYSKASMYVMTSRTESFGMVLIEAKSNNLPTLSFDVDFGPREIIENGKSGYLINAFDVQVMADRICELIADTNKRKIFSSHAGDNLSKFAEERIILEWENVIQNIL